MIALFDDFRDILVELHKAGARFVVLGGHAVAFHGHPRATKDLDILVEADAANAKRVYAALSAFGAPLSAFEVSVEDFASYDGVLQLGVPPRRIADPDLDAVPEELTRFFRIAHEDARAVSAIDQTLRDE